MRCTKIFLIGIAITAIILIISCGEGEVSKKTYKIAILPQYPEEVWTEQLQPLADYLSAETGENFELAFADNFEDHAQRMMAGEFEFGYQNPVVYAKISDETEFIAMALKDPVKSGHADKFRGCIFTRVEDNKMVVPDLIDLPGKKVVIVSYNAAGGYVSQMITLNEMEIDTSTTEFYEAEDNKHKNVVLDVYEGRADAGFVRESTMGMFDDELEDPYKLTVLKRTAWMPNWAFCAHKDVDPELVAQVKEALLKLPPESKEIEAALLTGFTEVDEEEFTKLKEYVE